MQHRNLHMKRLNLTESPVFVVFVLWFILRGDLFYVLPCVYFVLVFFSPFRIAITSLWEEKANLSALRTCVRFALVWFCLFPLPVCVWEGLWFEIVVLPGLFSYLFYVFFISKGKKGKRKVQGVPQSQTAALPRPQEEEETDKSKQAQTEQTYGKH